MVTPGIGMKTEAEAFQEAGFEQGCWVMAKGDQPDRLLESKSEIVPNGFQVYKSESQEDTFSSKTGFTFRKGTVTCREE